MNSTNDANNMKQNKQTKETKASATEQPRWQASSCSGLTESSHSSRRKLYVLLGLWAVVLTVAMAAAVGSNDEDQRPRPNPTQKPNAFKADCTNEDSCLTHPAQDAKLPIDVDHLNQSLPSSFRLTKPNQLIHAEWLTPVARILKEGKRPLRVLHIGDSHVAGKSFPQALKETLTASLGKASSATEGSGVWFSYVGSNGATSQRFLSDTYMKRFAESDADLIIVSLGTNEAHGMGYREDLHDRQLNRFFGLLKGACPHAVVVLTTPPGDYLTSSYVNYRRTSRHSHKKVKVVRHTSRPNPMSSRCAANIVSYGAEYGMPVWDLFSIGGGEEAPAQRNWVVAHMMRADRIHFEPAGYKVQGRLLGNAILAALATL